MFRLVGTHHMDDFLELDLYIYRDNNIHQEANSSTEPLTIHSA